MTAGAGLAPTTWHMASYLLPADMESFLLSSDTLSGPTEKKIELTNDCLHENLQCMSILTGVETGLLMLLLLAWQVSTECRSVRWWFSKRIVFTVLCLSVFS